MCVNSSASGSVIGTNNDASANGSKWLVTQLLNGAFKFSAKSASTNLVATDEEGSVKLRSYANNTDYHDEWELYNLVISLVNYYDSSITANDEFIENVAVANAFVQAVFEETFGLSIKMEGTVTFLEGTPADECNTSGHCNGNCGKGQHCKDVVINSNYIFNDTERKNNHIYVLWANRDDGTYCESLQNAGETPPYHSRYENTYAVVYDHRPVIMFFCIPDGSDDDPQKAMSILLAHEIAHSLGLEEQYNKISHDNGAYDCLMDKLYLIGYNYASLFNDIEDYLNDNGGVAPFCNSCASKIEACLRNNEPIKGN